MNKTIVGLLLLATAAALPVPADAQQTLTLEECRQMAVQENRNLKQARIQVEMSGYDRKIALANYFPNISATGTYLHNKDDIRLLSDVTSDKIRNMGTLLHSQTQAMSGQLMKAITANPQAAMEYMKSPLWQTVIGTLSQTDLSRTVNALGQEIDDALHPDLRNIYAGTVSIRQPVFMGGKIVAANKIAKLAEGLAETEYEQQYQQVIVDVDQAYWQIVSIANKQKLAESYADLLHKMEKDAEVSVGEGVATESDVLQVKVKANEADLLKLKSDNGLALARMLLCKLIGLPLDTDIVLADEHATGIPVPRIPAGKTLGEIYEDRPETRCLDLASRIHERKIAVARADMLPKVALTANYLVSNPNLKNGFQKDWGGFLSAGIAVNIPLFHGFEALQKTRKARAEATLYRDRLAEAKNLISLQVAQLRKQEAEALEKRTMAENNLGSAEENLRTATLGFKEGVITASTALAAQTAWLQARSEYIDAGIELQMLATRLDKAEGNHHPEK